MFKTIRVNTMMAGLQGTSGIWDDFTSWWSNLLPASVTNWSVACTQARTEAANAHNQVIDLANQAQAMLAEISQNPESTPELIASAQTNAAAALSVVQADTAMQNALENKLASVCVLGVGGFQGRSLKGLGIAPIIYVVGATMILLVVASIVGKYADATKTEYEAAAAGNNALAICWDAFKQSIMAQTTPPDCAKSPNTGNPGSSNSSSSTTSLPWMVMGVAGLGLAFALAIRGKR